MRFKAIFFSVFILLCWSPSMHGQTNPNLAIGVSPYGSYDVGNMDSVSLVNGNLNVHIPLDAYPQRGSLAAGYAIVYNDKNWWVHERCNDTENPCILSWQHISPTSSSVALAFEPGIGVTSAPLSPRQPTATIFTAHTSDGASHMLMGDAAGGLRAVDGSGIWYNGATATGPWITKARDGMTFYRSSTQLFTEDPNGNILNTLASSDSLGRTIPGTSVSTTDYSGCVAPAPPTVISAASILSLPGQNGSTRNIKICSATYHLVFNTGSLTTIDSNSNVDTIAPGDLFETLTVSIVAYNGSSWSTSPAWGFDYSSAGSLSKLTLPTGGTISYTWGTYIVCRNYAGLTPIGMAVTARTVDANDGTGPHTTTYTRTGTYTVVTDPNLNDTQHFFTDVIANTCSFYETQTKYFQGSYTSGSLLKTVNTDYSWQPNPFPFDMRPPSAVNVFAIRETTVWPNGQSHKVEKTYDASFQSGTHTYSYGELLTLKEFDYGGALVRTTTNTYPALVSGSSYRTNNLLNLISTSTVTNGSGTQVAKTTYSYDGSTLQSAGITIGRDLAFNTTSAGIRGNPTSVCSWLNTTGGNLCITTKFYDTGMPYTISDPAGHLTTLAYSSTYAGAYLTQTTLPVTGTTQHITGATYDFNTGQLMSSTDQNGRNRNFTYDALGRRLATSLPDGGQTALSYPDPVTIATLQKIDATRSVDSAARFDALGRLSKAQLNSDPDGTTYSVQTFDPGGRVSKVYNPTRCNPPTTNCESTWGFSTTNYDALNRVTSVTLPDGQVTNTTYTGNCSITTDPAGKARKSCTDGIGRLSQVFEDPNGLNYETDYSYDALNNLTCVAQKGSNTGTFSTCASTPASWRPRTFTYNSLSQLTQAVNPESGAVSYTYDNAGNLLTKTSPKPNQTGTAMVVSTYTYDNLNRLTQKSFNDSLTTTVKYGYDGVALSGCTTAPPTLTDSNPIGNRTTMCDGAGAESWSHDSIGRVLSDSRITNGVTKNIGYTYNLDGSLNTLTYPSGRTITYAYSSAGRQTTATDIANNVHWALNAHYAPHGALSSLQDSDGVEPGQGPVFSNYFYNNRLQPCRIFIKAGPQPTSCSSPNAQPYTILDLAYNYVDASGHNNGNVASVADGLNGCGRTQSYTYDVLNRILAAQVCSTTGWGYSYGYDSWGNLLTQTLTKGTGTQLNVAASTKNQIVGFTYDAAGNLLSDGTIGYTYDAENHLLTAAGATYSYDGDGNRVKKSTGNIYWYGADSDAKFYTDSAGNNPYEFIFFNGKRYAWRDPSGFWHFYHTDHLGNVRAISYGKVGTSAKYYYYPFGGLDAASNLSNGDIYRFTDQERDPESGNDNFSARFYASNLGRFISPDPDNAGSSLGTPQSWNAYSYVLNNPLNAVDPDGLDCIYLDNDTGRQIGFNRGDCDNSTEERANSGYYVDGTVDRSSIQTLDNWIAYTYKPEGSPLINGGAQCWGDCPNGAVIVPLNVPLPPLPGIFERGNPINDRIEAVLNRITPAANVISAFTGLDPSYGYCGPAEEEGPEGADHPKEPTKADEDLNNLKEVKDSRPKRPGPAATRNPGASARAATVGSLAEVPGLINNGLRCIGNSRAPQH